MAQTTDVLTFPKIPPADAVGMYLTSKAIEKTPHPFSFPRASARSQLTFFNTKHNLETLNKTLRLSRKYMRRYRRHLNARWAHLNEIKDQFRNHIIEANAFVESNLEKRYRYLQKMRQSLNFIEEKEEDTETIMKQIAELKEVKCKMEENIQKRTVYEDFLSVAAKCDQTRFKNALDIIFKYNDMSAAKREIVQETEHRLKCLENSHNEMRMLVQRNYLKHMQLTTDLSALLGRYETAKRNSLAAENAIYLIYQESIRQKLQSIAVKGTCWTLYQEMYAREFTKVWVKEEDTLGQLVVITKVMGLLSQVLNRFGYRHK